MFKIRELRKTIEKQQEIINKQDVKIDFYRKQNKELNDAITNLNDTIISLSIKEEELKKDVSEYCKTDILPDIIYEILIQLKENFGVINIDMEYEELKEFCHKNQVFLYALDKATNSAKFIDEKCNKKYISFPFKIGDITIKDRHDLELYNAVLDMYNKNHDK